MKTLILTLLVTTWGCTVTFAQNPPIPSPSASRAAPLNAHYDPGQAYKVTIQSAKGLVSVLDVPPGVFLNVQVSQGSSPSLNEVSLFPQTFRGELIIRTRRVDELAPTESKAASAIMAKAPVEMVLKQVIVVVEQVKTLSAPSR